MSKKSKVKSAMAQVIEQEPVDQITPQFQHIKELAKLKYEAEERREQNLIQQSSQMQTVFSFMTAALFMATPICIKYRGVLSLKYFFVSVSCITMFLLGSLVLASLAQWRWKTHAFPDVSQIKESVINDREWQKILVEHHRIDQWVDLIATVQAEKARLNDRRVKLIMASMICFYCSIVAIVISFITGIIEFI